MNTQTDTTERISLHGGHSGQFCCHAKDRLEDIIRRYIELKFPTVGISEHAPPENDTLLYPDEKKLNLSAADLYNRFGTYMDTIRSLQKKYAGQIKIYAGMETETCGDFLSHTQKLVKEFRPDYLVGSVHHVNDICFDYSKDDYKKLAEDMGSLENMYEAYFDLQYEMIKNIKPFVVGHIDLIRIYDDEYKKRLETPDILKKIKRNLELIKSLGLVMDYNLRPLAKGRKEPYINPSILKMVKNMGIMAVPGDDSHSVKEAGENIDAAIQTLKTIGFTTQWPTPVLIQ